MPYYSLALMGIPIIDMCNFRRQSDRHPIDLGYTPQFVELPPPEVMDEIANLYFIHCHNQPYSVFHEQSFKMNLQAGLIAPEVQYCVLGMAVRYPHCLSLSR